MALHVVIAGGGIAAVEAVMALRDLAGERVRISVIAPEPEFELKPLRTAEPFSVGHVAHYPLDELLEPFDVELVRDALLAVDAGKHSVALASGERLGYDVLVLAVGARPRPPFPQAITFGADPRTEVLNGLLADLEGHYTRSVAFVVPPGVAWPLPLYELALMTAREAWSMGIEDAQIQIVTPEPAPLALFGADASEAVEQLLGELRVAFHGSVYAESPGGGRLRLHPGDEELRVDRIVALPVLDGPGIAGLPSDQNGFIPSDRHGRVQGLEDVYAAGDGTDFPVKQGGLACQQADAVAEDIAARAGAPVEPRPFEPVLRGKLLTGLGEVYLRHDLRGGAGGGRASDFQLWWPPTKVSGRYLSQWLEQAGNDVAPPESEHVEIEVALPNAWEEGQRAMTLDPYSPPRH
jgi:sulfide:quinone oxidoreductase